MEAGSNGGTPVHKLQVPLQGLDLSVGASLGEVAMCPPWQSPSLGREILVAVQRMNEPVLLWEGFG